MRIFGTEGSFGFPHMDLYYYGKDHYGWNEPLLKEHFDLEINDPMAAELAHFVDLCQGREHGPRGTGQTPLIRCASLTAYFCLPKRIFPLICSYAFRGDER